jgi:hypothetical protein
VILPVADVLVRKTMMTVSVDDLNHQPLEPACPLDEISVPLDGPVEMVNIEQAPAEERHPLCGVACVLSLLLPFLGPISWFLAGITLCADADPRNCRFGRWLCGWTIICAGMHTVVFILLPTLLATK